MKNIFGINSRNKNPVKYSRVDYNIYFENTFAGDISLELLPLGLLNAPTGKIIACDPLVYISNSQPFTRRVPAGKYAVTACIAKTDKSGDRYAFAKLEFCNERASKWEMAIVEGQDINGLKAEDEYCGFPVDAGLGCFCDLETRVLYDQFTTTFEEDNPGCNIYDDFFADEFKKNALDQNDSNDIGNWLNFHLLNKPELNIIMFHSGYGDGAYPCFWGINDAGKICSLLVDFQVF